MDAISSAHLWRSKGERLLFLCIPQSHKGKCGVQTDGDGGAFSLEPLGSEEAERGQRAALLVVILHFSHDAGLWDLRDIVFVRLVVEPLTSSFLGSKICSMIHKLHVQVHAP